MMRASLPSIDEMIELGRTNPQALERIRIDAVESLINSASEPLQRRLRGLQFQIDCQRRLHKCPMGACLSLSSMMLESLDRLNAVLNSELADHHLFSSAPADRPAPLSASVLPFRCLETETLAEA